MSVREDLLNAIRALPLTEQQALLAELTAALSREARDATEARARPTGEAGVSDADPNRVLGMWRDRFDEAETSDEVARRWRRDLWRR